MTPPTAALSCPFCAKPPEVEECDDGSTWVSCSDGSMKCPAYGNGAELPVWNTRAPAVQATADADELAREIVLSVDAASAAMKGPRFAFEELQKEIAAIIRKAVSPKAAQEGGIDQQYKLVPITPTKEMLEAGDTAFENGYVREVYEQMVKAAPPIGMR